MIKKLSAGACTLISIVLYVITLLINYLGAGGYINGMSQKDISDKYTTLITPAPMTFAIWGVIYIVLLITLIYFYIKKDEPQIKQIILVTSPLLWMNFVLNLLWIILFSFEMLLLSSFVIFGILITLTQINQKLHEFWYHNVWLPALSFGLYCGWIAVATVVNISATFIKFNFGGLGISHEHWAVITIVCAAGILSYIVQKLCNAIAPLAMAWAFWGIKVAHQSETIYNHAYPLIELTLMPFIIFFSVLALFVFIQNSFRFTLSK